MPCTAVVRPKRAHVLDAYSLTCGRLRIGLDCRDSEGAAPDATFTMYAKLAVALGDLRGQQKLLAVGGSPGGSTSSGWVPHLRGKGQCFGRALQRLANGSCMLLTHHATS
eukprot:357821-Chlamydomonas_euryale.AAC.4